MTPTPTRGNPPAEQVGGPDGQRPDPVLTAAVDQARAAAEHDAGADGVGAYVGVHAEDAAAATHLFDALHPGYHGWRWAVTVAWGGQGTEVTVSEVVLLPGPAAVVAPEWVPWDQRVRAGDLGVGDLLPAAPDDRRLAPAYLFSDDPAVEEVATEIGLGRQRVLSRDGRTAAAGRWQGGDYGPRSEMARTAPATCGTCGFYLPLAGSLRAAFGACGNELAPADGHVVHAEYGCGAHSEVQVETTSPVPVADLVYDDAVLDVEPHGTATADERPGDAEDTADAERPAESASEDSASGDSAPENSAPENSGTQ